ncbi:ABC transporter ATP-binding protein [Clostridium sp. D2Q-11]|uniref:ABC transporter ATP-binding protein n=1 Tax=Anaeromonas frigoriresistens TaxID=2683708 RepID=A0A942Z9J9_9FIRM|nr:ABC transporter ATP-binding protein [Anaeromonas frigoriresistens]MBS4538940.1 ABC transporter ATP-binding protein [Anaeromonas frigoriresistens]
MSGLKAKDLTLSYGSKKVINSIDLDIPEGEISIFIGSNGCGKSTLLRSFARLMKPREGNIVLDGTKITKWPTKKIAKRLSILPQGPITPEGITVEELVKQGRYPYQNWMHKFNDEDNRMVKQALKDTQIEELADRPVDSLSGGQRQRAWIAMVLAQGTDMILLDEPTTYLDMTHQIEILDLLYKLNRKQKRTIVIVLHDLNLTCRYADHIIAVKDGKIYNQGSPKKIINKELVKEVFGMECEIMKDPLYDTPMCIPYSGGIAI